MIDLDWDSAVQLAKAKSNVNISASPIGSNIIDLRMHLHGFTKGNCRILFNPNTNMQSFGTKRIPWPRPMQAVV
tara:strand:+ start:477 stop:698 length:222 start_codon:yes stop_codon:yes gene_type:complete